MVVLLVSIIIRQYNERGLKAKYSLRRQFHAAMNASWNLPRVLGFNTYLLTENVCTKPGSSTSLASCRFCFYLWTFLLNTHWLMLPYWLKTSLFVTTFWGIFHVFIWIILRFLDRNLILMCRKIKHKKVLFFIQIFFCNGMKTVLNGGFLVQNNESIKKRKIQNV